MTAPLLPLTTEEVWRGPDRRAVRAPRRLAGAPTRCPPTTRWSPRWTRSATSARPGSALRKAAGLRNRLPLATLTVVVTGAAGWPASRRSSPTSSTSSRSGCWTADYPDAASYGVSQRLTVNARAAGPRLGKDVQTAIKALEVRRLVGGRRRHGDRGRAGAGGGRVHPGDRRRRAARTRPPGCCRAAASSCSTPRSRPSWRRRAWPATWCAPSSRPAATPDSTSPTGSSLTIGGPADVAAPAQRPPGPDRGRDARDVARGRGRGHRRSSQRACSRARESRADGLVGTLDSGLTGWPHG